MAYTIWSVFNWVFLPAGGIIALLVLSGFETLENLGRRICRFDAQIGSVRLTVSQIITFFCGCCFAGEWFSLQRLQYQRGRATTLEPLEYNDTWRALLWRHQRNWWMSLSSLILWTIIWRIDVLVQSFREEIRALEVRKIELLRERAESEIQKSSDLAKAASKGSVPPKPEKQKKRD